MSLVVIHFDIHWAVRVWHRFEASCPKRCGSVSCVGDAAHIVAKGLNLAVADVWVFSRGLIDFYRIHRSTLLDEYSARALDRVWKATRFSWWFTTLMHKLSDDPLAHRMQLAELR
jgi:p-hydroxybenzoate 3-monooxygenase